MHHRRHRLRRNGLLLLMQVTVAKIPGTVGLEIQEKNINLAVALKTGKYIRENLKDVKVIYTRDDDTFHRPRRKGCK